MPAMRPDGTAQPIDLFLASLRTAWKDRAIRPTDRPIVKPKWGRRHPDPLVRRLRTYEIGSKPNLGEPAANFCHDCRPSIPAITPDKLLRTLQRRLKVWRSEQADALLFGPLNKELADPGDRRVTLRRRGAR